MMVRHNLCLEVVRKSWVMCLEQLEGRFKKKAKQRNCKWKEETGSTSGGRTTSMRQKNSDKKLKSGVTESDDKRPRHPDQVCRRTEN